MLKTTILRQKQEKERLLALPYIKRDKFDDAKKWLESDLIKVVLGPRRAGKSVFCLSLLKDRPFMYFNFDDESLPSVGIDTEELMRGLHSAYGPTKTILWIWHQILMTAPSYERNINL
jgi:predicted AAA+ superfamily ATPase